MPCCGLAEAVTSGPEAASDLGVLEEMLTGTVGLQPPCPAPQPRNTRSARPRQSVPIKRVHLGLGCSTVRSAEPNLR